MFRNLFLHTSTFYPCRNCKVPESARNQIVLILFNFSTLTPFSEVRSTSAPLLFLPFWWKSQSKQTEISNAPRLEFGVVFVNFGNLSVRFCYLLVSFWRPLAFLGSLLVSLGSLLETLALDFLTFEGFWRHLSYFCAFFCFSNIALQIKLLVNQVA